MTIKKYLALKIDVDTLKGTKLGVPALLELLQAIQHGDLGRVKVLVETPERRIRSGIRAVVELPAPPQP